MHHHDLTPFLVRLAAPAGSSLHRHIGDLGRVLAVFAHPDDETYLAGGLLALSADAGLRPVVVTATLGEAGFDESDRWPPVRAAATRLWESRAAMAALGIADHRFLGYADGACATVDPHLAADRIAALVTEVRPDTLVTFGPDGITGHPDHVAVSRWVDLAMERVGHPVRVLHACVDSDRHARFAQLDEELGVDMGGGPRTVAADEAALHIDVDGALLDRKVVALRAMATQTGAVFERLGHDRFAAWVAAETFAAPISGGQPCGTAPATARGDLGTAG